MARVLIVDDDESQRLLHRRILERSRHDLFFARTGEEALKVCLRSGIEILLTDLEMEGGDGFELIEAIAGLDPPVAIIAVSGKGPHMLRRAKELGASAALAKPFDPAALVAAVAGLVDHAREPPS